MTQSRSRKSKALVAEPPVQLTVLNDEAALSALRSQTGFFSRAWEWLQTRPSSRSDSRRLRVAETVSLGEKRFVAVVQVAGRDFLVAGGPSNIALLAQLDPREPFEDVLHRTITVPGRQVEKPKRKAKKKAKPKGAAKPRNVTVAEQPSAPSPAPESFSSAAQKNMKPARKPVAKTRPVAAEPEIAPAIPPLNIPEAFRYAMQNAEANAFSKPANQQNGRAEPEHVGHWA
jgi:flagellar biogenesis protein FliO